MIPCHFWLGCVDTSCRCHSGLELVLTAQFDIDTFAFTAAAFHCLLPHCCLNSLISATDYSRVVFSPHAGPVVALAVSPFLPELLLSVGDWTFRLWHHALDEGNTVPLFVSPQADETYTAGEESQWWGRGWLLPVLCGAHHVCYEHAGAPVARQHTPESTRVLCHSAVELHCQAGCNAHNTVALADQLTDNCLPPLMLFDVCHPAAAWSPSRPGLLFLATSSGTLQVG